MSCRIQLNNYHRPYFPGDYIVGKVICEFESSEDVQGISVKLKGVERILIPRGQHAYHEKRRIFAEKAELASAASMAPGLYEFPFVFILPLQLPTSFAGRYGWITYTIKAVVVRPMKFDYKQKVNIPVISPLDQNKIEDKSLLLLGTFESEKKIWCVCCRTNGVVAMEVSLEKKTFAPGEEIKVLVKIKNRSNHSIQKVKARYWVDATSVVGGVLGNDTETQRTIIAKAKSDSGLGANDEKIYELLLKLPMVDAVPNFLDSKILTSMTGIEVVAVLSTFHFNMRLPVAAPLADIPIGGLKEYYTRIEETGVYDPPKKGAKIKENNEEPVVRFMGV